MVNNIKNSPSSAQTGLASIAPGGANDAKKAERAAAPAKSAAAAYAKAPAPTATDAANVQISQRARDLNQIRKVVDETPDVREDKVAHFKDLIAKGQYKPDAGKIADGMLNEAIKEELAKDPEQFRE